MKSIPKIWLSAFWALRLARAALDYYKEHPDEWPCQTVSLQEWLEKCDEANRQALELVEVRIISGGQVGHD